MKALTLWQPWAWAICYAGKDVENRTWRPSKDLVGQRIAIHAGLKRERGALRSMGIETPLFLEQGAIVAIATLKGFVRCEGTRIYFTDSAGLATMEEMQAVHRSPWFQGPIGWLLTDVVPIPGVRCQGQRGLWDVPDDVLAQVMAQLETTKGVNHG